MTTQLYTVRLTHLASYDATVAADTPSEAENIARDVLSEHSNRPVAGFVRSASDIIDVQPPVLAEQPVRTYRVNGIFRLNFSVDLPANGRDEAVMHARRLYDVNCGPFEFEHDGGDVERLVAEEVRS